MAMEKYFYSNGDQDYGPYTLSELKYGKISNSISDDTLIWTEESSTRKKAADLSELKSGQSTISPDMSQATSTMEMPVRAEITPPMTPPPIPQEIASNWHRDDIDNTNIDKKNKNKSKNKKEIFLISHFVGGYKKSFNAKGRASRTEVWSFFFCYLLIFGALIVLTIKDISAFGQYYNGVELAVFIILTIPANISLKWRRLHDINMSGGWMFLVLIPFVGSTALLIMDFMPGTQGMNKYGHDPRYKARDRVAPIL
jgi:uncharacterized membrane protein YhaH (DUF805 family)